MSEEVLAATEPCGAGSVAGEEDDTSLREVPAPCKEGQQGDGIGAAVIILSTDSTKDRRSGALFARDRVLARAALARDGRGGCSGVRRARSSGRSQASRSRGCVRSELPGRTGMRTASIPGDGRRCEGAQRPALVKTRACPWPMRKAGSGAISGHDPLDRGIPVFDIKVKDSQSQGGSWPLSVTPSRRIF